MDKTQGGRRAQRRSDLRRIDFRCGFIRQGNDDEFCLRYRVGNRSRLESVCPCSVETLAGTLADDHVDAGITQIKGVGPALVAVTDDRHAPTVQRAAISIRFSIYSQDHRSSVPLS